METVLIMQIEIRPNNNIPSLHATMTFLARQLSLSLHATGTRSHTDDELDIQALSRNGN